MDWLKVATNLYYHPIEGSNLVEPNPVWDDGEVLEAMWRKACVEKLPDNDLHQSRIPNIVVRGVCSLRAIDTVGATAGPCMNPMVPPLRQPPATTATRASSKRPSSGFFDADDADKSSDQDPKRQRRGLGQKGEKTLHNPMSLPEVSMVERDSPDTLSTRNGGLQRTGSQIIMPPPPVPASVSRQGEPQGVYEAEEENPRPFPAIKHRQR